MRMIVEIETETWREGDVLRTREIRKRFKVGPVYVPRFVVRAVIWAGLRFGLLPTASRGETDA